MAQAICGVFRRGKSATEVGTIEAVLAALPGQGRAERTDPDDAVSFGCRELWADVRRSRTRRQRGAPPRD